MRSKWKIGQWKTDSNAWNKARDLKIEGTNICVGNAFPDYQNDSVTVVIGRLSNISSKHRETINKPIDLITDNELTTAWEKSFQQVNDKLLN